MPYTTGALQDYSMKTGTSPAKNEGDKPRSWKNFNITIGGVKMSTFDTKIAGAIQAADGVITAKYEQDGQYKNLLDWHLGPPESHEMEGDQSQESRSPNGPTAASSSVSTRGMSRQDELMVKAFQVGAQIFSTIASPRLNWDDGIDENVLGEAYEAVDFLSRRVYMTFTGKAKAQEGKGVPETEPPAEKGLDPSNEEPKQEATTDASVWAMPEPPQNMKEWGVWLAKVNEIIKPKRDGKAVAKALGNSLSGWMSEVEGRTFEDAAEECWSQWVHNRSMDTSEPVAAADA